MTDYRANLIALLEGLECQKVEEAAELPAVTLRALGIRIALSAKLGAHLMPDDLLYGDNGT